MSSPAYLPPVAPPGWWRPQAPAVRAVAAGPAPAAAGAGIDSPANRLAFAALVAFTGMLFLSPQIWFPVLGTLRLAFVFATVAIGAHLFDRMVRKEASPAFSTEMFVALLLVSWGIVTIPVSIWAGGSVELLTEQYLKAVAFFWLIGTLAATPARLRTFAWALVICSVPLAITGVKNYLAGEFLNTGNSGVTRIEGYWGGSGIAGNPNDLALVLNLIIPIAAALMISTRSLAARAGAFAALGLSVAAVIITFSRAGFLTMAAAIVMLFAVLVRRRSAGAAGLLLVVALTAPVFVPAGYMDRLSTITNIEADTTGSAQGRWLDFVVAAEAVAANPIIGVGIGNDAIVLNQYRGEDTWRSVHNAYLQYAVDLGLPGVLLFAWLHLMCFRNARRVERAAERNPALRDLGHLAAGVQISLVAFFVAAMFHPIAYQFYFFTVAGLAVALRQASRADLPGRRTTPSRDRVAHAR